eukprot:749982-Hanusia_phi.AAC.1
MSALYAFNNEEEVKQKQVEGKVEAKVERVQEQIKVLPTILLSFNPLAPPPLLPPLFIFSLLITSVRAARRTWQTR